MSSASFTNVQFIPFLIITIINKFSQSNFNMSYITSFKFRLGGRGWQQQAHLHTCDAQISKVEANFVPLLLPLPLVNNKRGLDYIKQQQQQQEFDVRAAFLDCLP